MSTGVGDKAGRDPEKSNLTNIDPSAGIDPQEKMAEKIDVVDIRHPFAGLIADFMRRVQEMEVAATVAIPAIGEHLSEQRAKLKEVLRPHIIKEDDSGFRISYPDNAREASALKSAMKEFKRLSASKTSITVSRSIFIGLFCEFDAFIGSLLRLIYTRNEALYGQINRDISFSELMKFSSLDEIKKSILDKEIDSFRRESYVEQFSLMEKKFSISLTKFAEWPHFVEISQRRNLMTHNDGLVNRQYLDVCERSGYKFKQRPAVGEQLEISPRYYFKSTRILATVAFMLVYTLWRKIFNKEAKEANDALTVAVYDVLSDQMWGLAARLADFSLTKEMVKDVDDLNFRIRCINYAIGMYRCNERDRCAAFLKSKDWSACIPEFRLAVAVLSDEFEEACELMRSVGKEGVLIRQTSYHDWPLFFQFREAPEFLETYLQIYGASFNPSTGEDFSVSTSSDAISGAGSAELFTPEAIQTKCIAVAVPGSEPEDSNLEKAGSGSLAPV